MYEGEFSIWQQIDKHHAYIILCIGQCKKGMKADHAHYCQHCNKYKPRARVRYRKREKLDKIRKEERY